MNNKPKLTITTELKQWVLWDNIAARYCPGITSEEPLPTRTDGYCLAISMQHSLMDSFITIIKQQHDKIDSGDNEKNVVNGGRWWQQQQS